MLQRHARRLVRLSLHLGGQDRHLLDRLRAQRWRTLRRPSRFVEFFRDADLVIFDAMYSLADAISVKADWGHSSNIVGVELCQMAGARHLCLFHHEPMHGDEAIARVLAETRRYEEIITHRQSRCASAPPTTGWKSVCERSLRRRSREHPSYRRIAAIGIGLLVAAGRADLAASRAGTLRLQSAWFDTYQMLKPRDVASTPVTVVEIDERSLARLGQWPWPRTLLAELIRDIERAASRPRSASTS